MADLTVLVLFIGGFGDVDLAHKRAQYAQALFTMLAFLTTAYWSAIRHSISATRSSARLQPASSSPVTHRFVGFAASYWRNTRSAA